MSAAEDVGATPLDGSDTGTTLVGRSKVRILLLLLPCGEVGGDVVGVTCVRVGVALTGVGVTCTKVGVACSGLGVVLSELEELDSCPPARGSVERLGPVKRV